MNLQYTVTGDDYVRFNLHHYDTTPSVRAAVSAMRAVMPALLLLAGLFLSGLRPGVPLLVALALAVFWVWFLPRYVRRRVRSGIVRQVNAGHYAALLGEHRLAVTAHGIRCTDPAGAAEYAWSDIQRVGDDGETVYLYVAAATAVLVPDRAFADGAQRRQFLERVEQGRQSAGRRVCG